MSLLDSSQAPSPHLTQKKYLIEGVFHGQCRVIECIPGERPVVRLEETFFHPQGGGQKADRGSIGPAKVLHVAHHAGTVDHFVDSLDGIQPGGVYEFSIDSVWRKINSVYHTAGHLIASIVERKYPNWVALSGHQWPGEARVEFGLSETASGTTAPCLEELQSEINAAIASQWGVVQAGDPYTSRQIVIGEFPGIPCGGTHVESLKEISELRISHIKSKSGKIRVSYEALPS